MPATQGFAEELEWYLFKNIAMEDFAGVGDDFYSSANDGVLYIRLFTASPSAGGDYTDEATFTGYAAQSIARNTGFTTIQGGGVKNTSAITFPECTGGSETITHVAVCRTATGVTATDMIAYSALDTPTAISSGSILEFAVGSLDITIGYQIM